MEFSQFSQISHFFDRKRKTFETHSATEIIHAFLISHFNSIRWRNKFSKCLLHHVAQNRRTREVRSRKIAFRIGSEKRKSVEYWTKRNTTDVCFKYVNTYACTPLACIAIRNPNRQTIYNRIENLFPLFHSKGKIEMCADCWHFGEMFIDFQQLLFQKLFSFIEKLVNSQKLVKYFDTFLYK